MAAGVRAVTVDAGVGSLGQRMASNVLLIAWLLHLAAVRLPSRHFFSDLRCHPCPLSRSAERESAFTGQLGGEGLEDRSRGDEWCDRTGCRGDAVGTLARRAGGALHSLVMAQGANILPNLPRVAAARPEALPYEPVCAIF